MTAGVDLLELELRRLPGVSFVAFTHRRDVLVVQLVAVDPPDAGSLRAKGEQLCATHLDVAHVLEISAGMGMPRVRVVSVERRTADDRSMVEVRLAHDGTHAVGRRRGEGAVPAAEATLEALVRLGADVPFAPQTSAPFESHLGDGVMLALRSEVAGERYGLAVAPSVEQAAVRATLHALNRHLADQTFVPPSG